MILPKSLRPWLNLYDAALALTPEDIAEIERADEKQREEEENAELRDFLREHRGAFVSI